MAGRFRMSAQFMWRFDRYTLAARLQFLQAPLREQVRGQTTDLADRAEPAQLVAQAGDTGAAGACTQVDKRSIRPPIRYGCFLGTHGPLGSGWLQQFIQAHAHGLRQAGMDHGSARVFVRQHRRPDDARDAVGGGRLDAERTASGLGVCGKLDGIAGLGDGVVAQLGDKRLRIDDARLAEAKQGTDLGALPLRRTIGGIGQQRRGNAWLRHAKAVRQPRHRGPVQFGWCARETATSAEEQRHDREAEPVGPALGLDQRTVRQRQVPGAVMNGRAHPGEDGPAVTSIASISS